MNIGIKSTMRYINKGIDKGIDKMENAVSRKYKHMTGADIAGNGVARRMKSLKKAHSFHVKSTALGYTLGALEMAKGPGHTIFPGGEIFLAGVWQHCNAINSAKSIKDIKPQYKEIVNRAKAIYG